MLMLRQNTRNSGVGSLFVVVVCLWLSGCVPSVAGGASVGDTVRQLLSRSQRRLYQAAPATGNSLPIPANDVVKEEAVKPANWMGQRTTTTTTTADTSAENDIDGRRPSATSATSDGSVQGSVDFLKGMSWQCANNASCLYGLVNGVLASYRRGETIHFGLFDVVKLPPLASAGSSRPGATSAGESGRGISTFIDFISGNAIRIPVGPMVFSVQRSDDYDDYIEVALLKKATAAAASNSDADEQGRQGGLLSGSGPGGSGSGGVLGGSGPGLGGLGGLGSRRRKNQDKKQFQMFIPMYLAATTFGWTLVAAKAVGLLTLKALAISKLAFIVAAMVVIKKFMDNASDKMMYQFPEHSPYMMPYSMDYPMHSMGGPEMATAEMYPAALHLAAAAAPIPHHVPHHGLESLAAESHLHHNVAAEMHNNTQVLAALNAVGLGQKVKRDDSWIAKSLLHSQHGKGFAPTTPDGGHRKARYAAHWSDEMAAVAAAEKAVEYDEDKEHPGNNDDDDIDENSAIFRDALEYMGYEI